MLFYKAEGIVKSGITTVERGYGGNNDSGMFSQLSDTFFYEHKKTVYTFVRLSKKLFYTIFYELFKAI